MVLDLYDYDDVDNIIFGSWSVGLWLWIHIINSWESRHGVGDTRASPVAKTIKHCNARHYLQSGQYVILHLVTSSYCDDCDISSPPSVRPSTTINNNWQQHCKEEGLNNSINATQVEKQQDFFTNILGVAATTNF